MCVMIAQMRENEMKRLALIVQGDETLSNRQRILVNPVRFRTPQELKEVLSSELNNADGTPMVLPPSASLSFLDPAVGTYVPLLDTSVLTNNSRIRIERSSNPQESTRLSVGSGGALLKRGSTSTSSTTAAAAAASAVGSGVQHPFYSDASMTEATITELLVYHAQVVSLLSAHVRPEREITPQDVQASYELQSESTRSLVNDMWRQKNVTSQAAGGPGLFSSALSQIKIVTQFALQRGATEREASEGEATERLKETVSAFQRRVDRLEKELAETTTALETAQKLLLVASHEKETAVAELTEKLEHVMYESEMVRANASSVAAHSAYVEKELATVLESQQRSLLDSFVPPDPRQVETAIPPQTSAGSLHNLTTPSEGSFLPTTLQEEKYLAITKRPATTLSASRPFSTTKQNVASSTSMVHHHPLLERPTSAPSGMLPAVFQQHPLNTSNNIFDSFAGATPRSTTMEAGILAAPQGLHQRISVSSLSSNRTSPSTQRPKLNVVLRYLPRGSLAARQETVNIGDPHLHVSFERFCAFVAERCGFAVSSVMELSYVKNGNRQIIFNNSGLAEFIVSATESTPLPGSSRGPAPMSLSVIEFDPSERTEESPPAIRKESPGAGELQAASGESAAAASDDETSDVANISAIVAKTPAQRARLAGAHFLGKTLKPEDFKSHRASSGSASTAGGALNESQDSPKLKPGASKVLSAFARIRPKNSITGASTASTQPDGLSTRSLFLHSACITVPTEDDIRSMFNSLAKGASTADRESVAQFLIKRYDDVGDPAKFYRLVGLPLASLPSSASSQQRCASAPPVRTVGPVDLEEFSMIVYRLVRE